jgi:hypothetical protein
MPYLRFVEGHRVAGSQRYLSSGEEATRPFLFFGIHSTIGVDSSLLAVVELDDRPWLRLPITLVLLDELLDTFVSIKSMAFKANRIVCICMPQQLMIVAFVEANDGPARAVGLTLTRKILCKSDTHALGPL